MSTFQLHQLVLEDIADRELSDLIGNCVAECKRRALLKETYNRNVDTIVKSIAKNVDVIEAREASKTPVLDRIRKQVEGK